MHFLINFLLQEKLPPRDLDVINALRTAFMPPSLGVMEVAVEEFKVHHELVFHHCMRIAEYDSRLAYVVAGRAQHVVKAMEEYDLGIALAVEATAWSWSSLFLSMCMGPTPPCIERPFRHTETEWSLISAWMLDEEKSGAFVVDPPPFAMALKL